MKGPATQKLCTCIATPDFGQCLDELRRYPFAELRADLCGLSPEQTEKATAACPGIIFTLRFPEKDADTALGQYLAAINNGVAFVDVDICAPKAFVKKVKDAISASGGKTRLILSTHPENTPSLEEMEKTVALCQKTGADIVKIAPLANNLEEASRVLRLYHRNFAPESLLAFARGEAGTFTRVSCIGLGAPFTYCCADKPVAQGQLTHKQMSRLLGDGQQPVRIPDMRDSLLFSRFCEPAVSQKGNRKEKSVSVPCSKSIVQRALLAAAICRGETILRNFEPCQDTKAAIGFIRKCGCVVKSTRDGLSARGEKMLIVRSAGIAKWKSFKFADMGESALLARMALPLAALASTLRNRTAIAVQAEITGEGSLLERDFSSAIESLKAAGVKCTGTKKASRVTLPVVISGASFKKEFTVSGKDSSQIISGLLLVLPLLSHNTKMTVNDAVSIPFIELTIKVLEAFGIKVNMKREGRTLHFEIEGKQIYYPVDMFLEADWSSASNFAVAGTVASFISSQNGHPESFTIKRMSVPTTQADERILEVLRQCGSSITFSNVQKQDFAVVTDNKYNTRRSFYHNLCNMTVRAEKLSAFCFDATDCPDLFPILATLAVCCNGQSRIKGAHRLENKESNRSLSILQEFSRMGYEVYIENDDLVIQGRGGRASFSQERIFCSSHNDHRMAMAIIVCALTRSHLGNPPAEIFIDDISCTEKSFPTFAERLKLNIQA